MSDTWVVTWRRSKRFPWEVQPRIYSAVNAHRVAGLLVDRHRGEACAIPIEFPPPAEDSRDSEEA